MPSNFPLPLAAVLTVMLVSSCVAESPPPLRGEARAGDVLVADGSALPLPPSPRGDVGRDVAMPEVPGGRGAGAGGGAGDAASPDGDAASAEGGGSIDGVTPTEASGPTEGSAVPEPPPESGEQARTLPAPTATTGEGRPVPRLVLPETPLRFERPDAVRGLYVNAWAAGSQLRTQALIELAERTEINTFVIDLKDATGYVSHPTQVMFAREVGADQEIRIRDLVGLLERLHEAGIYPIARIVIVKDPLLVAVRPDLAVQDTAGGVWVDDKDLVWANMYDPAVWEYHVELAKEAVAVGFPEIQWDYLRFPDAPEEELNRAWYPGQGARWRSVAIREFLEYARKELDGVVMTADVFGMTTSARTDIGIGQLWEDFIGAVDVALPMVYPSHYWVGSFGIEDPNGHPYEIVRRALTDAVRRSAEVEGAGATRPWLQDFTLGAPPYGAPEVRAQIEATYDVGIDEWILWNPSSRYTEAALAPEGGYPEGTEPSIRVGGTIVPVSERAAALEAERKAAAPPDSVANAAVDDTVAIPR